MYKYKVLKWQFDLNTAEELEEALNEYAEKGWRIFNITSNIKGGGSVLLSSIDANEATIIFEKVV